MAGQSELQNLKLDNTKACPSLEGPPTAQITLSTELKQKRDRLLYAAAFFSDFKRPISQLTTPPLILELLQGKGNPPLQVDNSIRQAVRKLLRQGGFKPSGRNRPASEYLAKALSRGLLAPINPVVDICNVVSLHSGLPISVVDAEKALPPYSIIIGEDEASYVFNPSGQVLKLSGLLCLCDRSGPCGSPVKDSQRTKTDANTRSTLTIIWGTRELPQLTEKALTWYHKLLQTVEATISPVLIIDS